MTPILLLDGAFRPSLDTEGLVQAIAPASGLELPEHYPISGARDIELALRAAEIAAPTLAATRGTQIAAFLERYAELIEMQRNEICAIAHLETGLPLEPRLNSVELPRTVQQLRLAAIAARNASWSEPVIDTANNIRRCLGPLGKPVWILGPNNFPLAFNAIAGSDFACALVARNPVIAKAHPSQPGTTLLLAKLVQQALNECELPPASVQMFYQVPAQLGLQLAGNPRLGALAFTGGRSSGLALKAAADTAGVPSYLEMSSINPVFLLPGALRERGAALVLETFSSCTLGSGQFCTNPGVLVLLDDPASSNFVEALAQHFSTSNALLLLGKSVLEGVQSGVQRLLQYGAQLLAQGSAATEPGLRHPGTLLSVTARQWLDSAALHEEVFGPVTLLVRAENAEQLSTIAAKLSGELTAAIFSASDGSEEELALDLSQRLRPRVGRLLNDKFPTGVAVSPAMNHGGPWPAAGHPGFTAVGIPDAIRRFTALHCYDNVREQRLPPELRNRNPDGLLQRRIDGVWSCADVD